jgi:hypothetical protein
VLVADELESPLTASAQQRLTSAGFAGITVLAHEPQGLQSDSQSAEAAA